MLACNHIDYLAEFVLLLLDTQISATTEKKQNKVQLLLLSSYRDLAHYQLVFTVLLFYDDEISYKWESTVGELN